MSERSDAGYVLWLGGVFDHATMLARAAVNPAARRTQRELLVALREEGVRVRTLGHVPEPLWPKGRLRDAGHAALEPGIEGDTVSYWNVPGLRTRGLIRGYLRAYERLVRLRGRPGLVLSYNAYPYNVAVGRRAQAEGIPWVPLIADVPRPGPERERHDRAYNEAAGRVFLSWSEFGRPENLEPKLHVDNGMAELRLDGPDGGLETPPVVVYTGSLGPHAGVNYLLEAFRHVARRDVELWICGFGDSADVRRAAAEDPRVRFLGLLPEERLEEVYRRATVFVNPRPSSRAENAGNFPSKLLDYLKYGRPTISTWTAGIEPGYRSVLTVLEEETPEALAGAIEDVVAWPAERRAALAARIRDFVESEKLWSVQARRLVAWLRDELGVALAEPASRP